MNCMEAQAKIFAFIDNKLDTEESIELIEHIRGCKDCEEELEVNYALITAVNEDINQSEKMTYQESLAQKIAGIEQTFRNKILRIKWKRALFIAFLIVAGLMIK